QGIATTLLQECVRRLRARELIAMVDATPAGRKVYRRLGFRDGWELTRWRRAGSGAPRGVAPSPHAVRALQESDWPALAELDAHAFGAGRLALLRQLA